MDLETTPKTTDVPTENPAPAEVVEVPAEEYARLQEVEAQLETARAEHQAKLDAIAAETAAAHRNTERAVAERDAVAVDMALLDAMEGVLFVNSDARGACRELLRGHLEARQAADGTTKVVEKATGRPASDFVRDRLGSGSMNFFLAPTTRGGSGSDGAQRPAPQQQHQPGSFADVAERFRKQGPGGLGLYPLS